MSVSMNICQHSVVNARHHILFVLNAVVNHCKKVNCGGGECVLIKAAPFYECKCKAPFQPPNCKKGKKTLTRNPYAHKMHRFKMISQHKNKILSSLSVICSVSPPAAACKPNPCINGGTCQKGRTRNKFTCLCPPGYSGKFCQVGKVSPKQSNPV